MNNHYQTLGVERGADATKIKQAYRRLASQHHPDKGGDKNKFQEIEQAYRTLSDPQLRAQYDNPPSAFGSNGFGSQTNGPGAFNFESIFDIFGARFQHPHQQQQRRAQHAVMTLWITLRDVAQGGSRSISVGTHQGTMAVEIEIPLGINDGDSVQYSGIGPGGIDLVITYRIHPDPKWVRQGLTLQAEHTVSIWDLILGCETPIKDILGNTLSLTVQPGTQPGTTLRLRGRGLNPRAGGAGDLLIKLQAQIPNDIPQELLDHIIQIRNQ
jgi:curved DNA-binding protein